MTSTSSEPTRQVEFNTICPAVVAGKVPLRAVVVEKDPQLDFD